MLNFKTDVPEIDSENEVLLRAAGILETCGNFPGLTAVQFQAALLANNIGFENEDFEKLTTAAIAIETMMSYDTLMDDYSNEPTIH